MLQKLHDLVVFKSFCGKGPRRPSNTFVPMLAMPVRVCHANCGRPYSYLTMLTPRLFPWLRTALETREALHWTIIIITLTLLVWL